jgi:hypothetical protein
MQYRALGVVLAAAAVSFGGCGDDGGSATDAGATADAAVGDPSEAVFDPERLLVVEIDMLEADWDLLRFEHHDFLEAVGTDCQDSPPPKPYNFYPASVTIDGEVVANVGVRKKGFLGSVTPIRPSLKVKFDEYDADQRWSGLRRLTLNNNNQDESQLNTCMTYHVFREAGSPAPRCNYARVILNGEDLGIFSNVEAIKRPMLRRWFEDDTGNLYEGVVSDFRDGWTDTFELKGDDPLPDRGDLDTVGPALALPDDQVMDALDAVVDVDAYLTFWAAEVLVNHWDGYAGNTNNFFVYHDPTSDTFRFIPWGPDATFGIPNVFPPTDRPASVHAVPSIPRRVYNLTDGRAAYQARLQEVLDDAWDETALLAEVDRIEALIGDHVWQGADFEDGVSRVRDFITGRRAAIEAELNGTPPPWDHALRGDPCMSKVADIVGTFDTTWESPFPQAFPLGVGSGTMTATYGQTVRNLTNLGFNAGRDDVAGGDRQGVFVFGIDGDTSDGFGVYLGVEPELYTTGTIPVDMYTTFAFTLEGPLGPDMDLGGFIFGTMELTEAGTGAGEAVTGSFDLEVWRGFSE